MPVIVIFAMRTSPFFLAAAIVTTPSHMTYHMTLSHHSVSYSILEIASFTNTSSLTTSSHIESRDSVVARLMLPPSSYRFPSGEERILTHVSCLQYLSAHTGVPVPKVYDSCTTSDNPIGAPYILMQAVAGKNLLDQGTGLALHSVSTNTA